MKNSQRLARSLLVSLLLLGALTTATTSFAHHITISRYLSVAEKPQSDQQQLLQQQIQIQFPQNVLTIQQAVEFILQFSGYRLVHLYRLNQSARDMLSQPLPEVDRTLGPMTLAQGLTTLAGHAFYLLIDPVHRLIGYKIKPNYHGLYQTTH